jgi:hypothetical protein
MKKIKSVAVLLQHLHEKNQENKKKGHGREYQWLSHSNARRQRTQHGFTLKERKKGTQEWKVFKCSQTGSGAYRASYPMGTGGSFSGSKATGARSWPLTSIQCWVQEYRNHPFPHTLSRRSDYLVTHWDAFAFMMTVLIPRILYRPWPTKNDEPIYFVLL